MKHNKILLALATVLVSTTAHANSINSQLYRSPFNLNYGMLESPLNDNSFDNQVTNDKIFVSANYNYAKDPIIVKNVTSGNRISSLVGYFNSFDLSAGYLFKPNLAVFAQLPVDQAHLPGGSKDTVIGDARLDLKWGLTDAHDAVSFAVMPEITFPTGSKTYFLTDDGVTAGLLLLAEKQYEGFRLNANLGYRYSSSATYANINYRNRFPYGLGADIALAKKWSLNPEFTGFLAAPTSNKQNPGEFYAGLNFHPHNDIAFIGGGSVGTTDRQASLNYRLILGVRMYLGAPVVAKAAEPAPPPVVEQPAPPKPAPRAKLVNNHIEILDMVNFENDKAILTPSGRAILDEVARVILENSAVIGHVLIEGHTSLTGSAKHNLLLSEHRALAVQKYLVDKGVPVEMLSEKGYGLTRPKYIVGKATKAELELNRRVEFLVTPKK